MDQKTVDTAIGFDLDCLGAERGVHRQINEADAAYRSRIKADRTGGPAFGDLYQAGACAAKTGGMTLRDYFAAKAMQAFAGAEYNSTIYCAHWAKHAYMMADAMLAERVKP